jgi:hypothetical protein
MNYQEKHEKKISAPQGHKMCGTCCEYKPTSDFSRNAKSPDLLQRACKGCNKVTNKTYREKNPDWYVKWSRANPDRVAVIVKRYDSKLPPGVYKLTNTVTNRVYIGQSRYPFRRKVGWRTILRKGEPDRMITGQLLEDLKSFGHDKFVFDYIEFFGRDVSTETLLERERFWIQEYGKSNELYNRQSLG